MMKQTLVCRFTFSCQSKKNADSILLAIPFKSTKAVAWQTRPDNWYSNDKKQKTKTNKKMPPPYTSTSVNLHIMLQLVQVSKWLVNGWGPVAEALSWRADRPSAMGLYLLHHTMLIKRYRSQTRPFLGLNLPPPPTVKAPCPWRPFIHAVNRNRVINCAEKPCWENLHFHNNTNSPSSSCRYTEKSPKRIPTFCYFLLLPFTITK